MCRQVDNSGASVFYVGFCTGACATNLHATVISSFLHGRERGSKLDTELSLLLLYYFTCKNNFEYTKSASPHYVAFKKSKTVRRESIHSSCQQIPSILSTFEFIQMSVFSQSFLKHGKIQLQQSLVNCTACKQLFSEDKQRHLQFTHINQTSKSQSIKLQCLHHPKAYSS